MGSFFRFIMRIPIFRPLTRFLLGALAIPVFRFFLTKIVRLQDLDAELEKDLEQWFSCSLVLLVSTQFMEPLLFDWLNDLPALFLGDATPISEDGEIVSADGKINPLFAGLRILLAIGVIEAMPDQELFAIVHPGPPKLKYDRTRSFWSQVREHAWPYSRGFICQHINRSSPVFAILAAIIPGLAGIICYLIAIIQYLIIGLVTSRDKALDVLGEFDRQVAIRRREIIEEFDISDKQSQRKESRRTDSGLESEIEPAAHSGEQRSVTGPIVAKADEGGYLSK